MRPVLFSMHFGGTVVRFPSYGALVALGFALGIGLFVRGGRRRGFDPGRLQDLAFSSVLLGLLGARVAFVLVNARAFVDACSAAGGDQGQASGARWVQGGCWAPLRFWDGGLVFYGGALAVAGVVWFYCRRDGWSFLRLGDLAAPSVALGHALGRIGCLMAGCCYGQACAAPWGVRFGPGSVAFDESLAAGGRAGLRGLTPPLHPTQIYEALGELAIFLGLVGLQMAQRGRAVGPARPYLRRAKREGEEAEPETEKETETEKQKASTSSSAPGRVLGIYVLAYTSLRFGVEIFRGDVSRGYVFRWAQPTLAAALGLARDQALVLSTSQAMSVLLGVAAAIGLWRGARSRKRAAWAGRR